MKFISLHQINLVIKHKITNISALQFFQILRYSTLVLISVLFAKSKFSQITIGEYETLLFIAGGVSFFWINSLIKSFLSIFNDEKNRNSDIFNFYLLISFFSVILFFTLKLFIINNIAELRDVNYLELFLYYILLLGGSSITEYILLAKNKIKEIFVYGIVSYFLQLLLIVFSIYYFKNFEYVLYSLIFINILRNIYTFSLVAKYSILKFSYSFMKENIKLSIPLMLSFVLSGSSQYIDGIIVKYKFNDATFAVFRYGTKEFPLLVILSDALSNAMIREFNKENLITTLKKLKQKSLNLINLLFPISILLLIFSSYLFQYVFNKQFIESSTVFDIYLLLIISRLVFPQTIFLGLKNSKTIFIASLIEFLINVIFSLFLVQFLGIQGVALATVIAFICEKIFLIYVLKAKYNISINQYINTKSLLIFSIILVSTFILKYFIL